MEIPKLAIDKESKNLYHIYLFYVEAEWWAFGHSAYYLNIMCPTLGAIGVIFPECDGWIPCVQIPERYLLKLSDFYKTLVSDAYIQVSAPPVTYCYRKKYDNWCKTLTVTNINSF